MDKKKSKGVPGKGVLHHSLWALPKGNNPHGRIIHDFSFGLAGEKSINASLFDNSVKYITFAERVEAVSSVDWYVSVDMKNGYR